MAGYVEHFGDLKVYQRLYQLMFEVHKNIIPKLPEVERSNLGDQLRRASQAAPALLAEGFAKRFQPHNWSKYLTDAIGESQEMVHHLSCVMDIYSYCVDPVLCALLIDEYTIAIKQLLCLGNGLKKTHENKNVSSLEHESLTPTTKPPNH